MAIEINNVTTIPSQVTEAGTQARPAPQPAADKSTDRSATQTQSTDQVSLTPTAQQLRGLEQQIANQPVVDTQKVNTIKESLASGSFEVDPNRIAGNMMSLEKALGDMS